MILILKDTHTLIYDDDRRKSYYPYCLYVVRGMFMVYVYFDDYKKIETYFHPFYISYNLKIIMTSTRTILRRRQGLDPTTFEEDIEIDNTLKRSFYKPPIHNSQNRIYEDNGEIYRGQVQNDRRHGEGQMIYSNGVVYEGLWENDKPKNVKVYMQYDDFLKDIGFLLSNHQFTVGILN